MSGLQFLPCTTKLVNRLGGFGWAWEAVVFFCNLWASLWAAMRGALSHVEQYAFGHLQNSEHTLDVAKFFSSQSFSYRPKKKP